MSNYLVDFSEQEFQNAFKKIYLNIVGKCIPATEPFAVILGGQPGAGKTTLHRIVLGKNSNTVIINGDDFRKYHPRFLQIEAQYGDKSPDYTQDFTNRVVETLIETLGREKYNLIVEGTLRTSETPLATCENLKGKGYAVELSVIAVHKESSWQGTIDRFNEMKKAGLVPRKTPKEKHDAVVEKISENLDILYKSGKFDNITLYDRDMKRLYDMKETPGRNPAEILSGIIHGNAVKRVIRR